MKKLFLLSVILIGCISLNAQTPEAIYIATWSTMGELGTPITPNEQDPQLTYNPATECYEGTVTDWPRLAVNPYIAKIPYSMENDVITYYGVEGPTQQFIFNTDTSKSFEFTESTDPYIFKGFGLSLQNSEGVVDVEVSMNLTTKVITFSKIDSQKEIPELLNVTPENGSEIQPEEDGSVVVTLTFNGEITSLEAISDGAVLPAESSNEGTVWTVTIPAERVEAVAQSSEGRLVMTIQKVYSGIIPVSFENGNPVLHLNYAIAGITHEATFVFEGDEAGIETLNVYKSPEYSVGDEVEFEGTELSFTYTNSVTYLFTVGIEYDITITSTVEREDDENWKLGEGYSTKKGANGESTNQKVADGVTLTIYGGATGAQFSIIIEPKEAGVNSIIDSDNAMKVYSIDGGVVTESGNSEALKSLKKGIYIINGKKVLVK